MKMVKMLTYIHIVGKGQEGREGWKGGAQHWCGEAEVAQWEVGGGRVSHRGNGSWELYGTVEQHGNPPAADVRSPCRYAAATN